MIYILGFCVVCALICWACCAVAGRCDDEEERIQTSSDADHVLGTEQYLIPDEMSKTIVPETCNHIWQRLSDELPDEDEIREKFPYLNNVKAYCEDHPVYVCQCIKCGKRRRFDSHNLGAELFMSSVLSYPWVVENED